jgi:hypothetical protein
MFLHPTALWGLLAALAPLVIYLILRRRKKEVAWGASYLLRKTLASKRKSSVWKQYVVLAVRTLILALMALLIAQPFRARPSATALVPEPPADPVHRVLLLDDSSSMTVGEGEDTRLSRLKKAVAPLLASQRVGDFATVLSLVDPATPFTPKPLAGTVSPAEITALLDRVTPREAALHLPAALARAMAALDGTPHMTAEIYLFSDFPRDLAKEAERLANPTPTPGFAGGFRGGRGDDKLRLVAVNLADGNAQSRPSISVESATIGSDLVIAGVPVNVHVDVVNRSDTETVGGLRLAAPGLAPREEPVVLPPNGRRTVAIPATFTQPGATTLTVGAVPQLLRSSSETSVSVEVRPQLHALLLEDPADPGNPQALSEGEFLRRAFADGAAVKITSVNLLDLTRPIAADVDLVIIAGARVVTPAIAEPLTQFLRKGGGLIVAMSQSVVPLAYNETFKALLPAPIEAPQRAGFDPESFQGPRADALAATVGLFTEFGSELGAELASARFYNFMRLGSPAENARTVLELSERRPLLVERPIGRGRVLLFTSSLGVSWNSLPVRQTYVAFMHRLLHSAAAGRSYARNLQPGEPFMSAWASSGAVTVVAPDQSETTARPLESAGRMYVVVPGQTQRGGWQVRGANGQAESFTVVAPPAETDLRTVDATQTAALEAALGTRVHAGWPAAVAALGPMNGRRVEWEWILGALLAFYLFETWFVRRL